MDKQKRNLNKELIQPCTIYHVSDTVCGCRHDQWCINCYEQKKSMILGEKQTGR